MRQLEAHILAEAKRVTKNIKLRQKDIIEWTTGKIEPHEGEEIFDLPDLGINIAVKKKVQENTEKKKGEHR